MILSKYIFREILKIQLVTLLVLMLVFLCQSVIRYVGKASVGSIPVDIVVPMVLYSIPSILYLMLPLTLFVGIISALGRISSDSEMVVMRSVGFSPAKIMTICMFLAVFTAAATLADSIWLMPEAVKGQRELSRDAASNPQYLPIESGRFVDFGKGRNFMNIYIEDVEKQADKEKSMGNVYVMADPFSRVAGSFTIAEKGQLSFDSSGVQWLVLHNGSRYEGPLMDHSSRSFAFSELRLPVTSRNKRSIEDDNISAMASAALLDSGEKSRILELQWRLAPFFAVFILTATAVPLSMVNPRQGRFAKLAPAILLYISYYLLLLSCRNMINAGSLPVWPGLYAVPVIFTLAVVLPLNVAGPLFSLLAGKKKPQGGS